jgi:hypothetical protein
MRRKHELLNTDVPGLLVFVPAQSHAALFLRDDTNEGERVVLRLKHVLKVEVARLRKVVSVCSHTTQDVAVVVIWEVWLRH